MNGEQGDLRADHIELLLAAGENRLDRLDARGAVDVTLDKRRGSGATLVYRPADERYEITGSPGRFIDECNESAGKTLTFFKSSDRVIIDGNEEVRTETRGGKCAAKPPELMSSLRTQELTKSYGGRTVVKGVSLEVNSGEVVGLLGPNGAGKTTTFYMTVGLTAPDSGRVLFDGTDITDDAMYVRARKGIGYLPQEPSIFRGLTVEQNILAILETLPLSGAERRQRAKDLLAELGLSAAGRLARLRAVRRRAAARRDHARPGHVAALHPARRALRRHRPDCRHRHPEDHLSPQGTGHRRPHHRPQCA